MTTSIKYIDLKQQVLSRNRDQAAIVRAALAKHRVFMLNLMASPGSGKTSLILQTIRRLREQFRIAVVEGDIESTVDSEKIAAEGVPAVQLRTGGSCHLEAAMVGSALVELPLAELDLLFVENIGNLVCPASFDIGASLQAMILSVPEGDDKILKYPAMFATVDALVINKMDYLALSDFNVAALRERMQAINPSAQIFEISCKDGRGLDQWCAWLAAEVVPQSA